MWRHLAIPVGKGHRHLVSFTRWVSGIVGDQGQNVMQTGLGVVGDQGANVVGAVSKWYQSGDYSMLVEIRPT